MIPRAALLMALLGTAGSASAADQGAPPPRGPGRPSVSAARRWACFYGAEISERAWKTLDLAVVDPDNFRVPAATGPLRLAYVSAGEADERRAFWPSARGKPWLVESNPDWPGAHRVDLRSPEWRSLVLDTVVSSALARGYQGVMLDTLDVAEHLESSAPARYAGSVQAAAELVLALRARHPEALILMNNGLALLDRVAGAIDGLLIEDLYTRCMPGQAPCGPSPAAETAAKEAALDKFRRTTGKPVFVLLYSRLHERRLAWVRKAAARARRRGFFPYLSTPTLERLGAVDPGAGK